MAGWYGLIELVLVFGSALGLLLYELRSVRREIRRDRERSRRDENP